MAEDICRRVKAAAVVNVQRFRPQGSKYRCRARGGGAWRNHRPRDCNRRIDRRRARARRDPARLSPGCPWHPHRSAHALGLHRHLRRAAERSLPDAGEGGGGRRQSAARPYPDRSGQLPAHDPRPLRRRIPDRLAGWPAGQLFAPVRGRAVPFGCHSTPGATPRQRS